MSQRIRIVEWMQPLSIVYYDIDGHVYKSTFGKIGIILYGCANIFKSAYMFICEIRYNACFSLIGILIQLRLNDK
jgi:hypothetical protein